MMNKALTRILRRAAKSKRERESSITVELLEDLIWKNGGANSNIQPDDLKSAAEAVLKAIKGK